MTPTQLAVAVVLSSLHVPNADLPGLPSASEAVAITRVVYNEARGHDPVCKALVAQTVLNRYAVADTSVIDVTHKPYQFANSRPDPQNETELQALVESAEAAVFVYSGLVHVPHGFDGVTHFHMDNITKPPSWGDNVVKLGEYCSMIWYVETAR